MRTIVYKVFAISKNESANAIEPHPNGIHANPKQNHADRAENVRFLLRFFVKCGIIKDKKNTR